MAQNRFSEIRDLIMGLEGDFEKFYDKGNQAAGTRVRQGMQTLKVLAQDIRAKVQELKNAKDAEDAKADAKPAAKADAKPAAKADAKDAKAKKDTKAKK